MEKRTCKLCFRCFSNGRALGGHMRSHVMAAAAAAPAGRVRVVLSDSSSSISSREAAEEEATAEQGDGKGSGLSYGLRENPRKSFRLVDPEFAAVDAGSSVVQDRESETESPRAAPAYHRRRSKRPRRGPPPEAVEPEPVSSVSDATPEEDVAISLMMLSRDVWTKSTAAPEQQETDGSDHDYDDDGKEAEEEQIADRSRLSNQQQPRRSRYQCVTCKKVFRSYQALGGHRASHKKMKQVCVPAVQIQIAADADSSGANANRGSKRCTSARSATCIFGSGQALSGHKQSHLSSSATTNITITSSPSPPLPPSPVTAKCGVSLIDLNLPASMDEDAAELSAVSDAVFVVGDHPSH